MNILLWVIQIFLAMLCIAGGSYKVFKFNELATVPAIGALPRGGWRALGLFEMMCGILLVLPAVVGLAPLLIPLAGGAVALALESLALGCLYARYSTKLNAANPLAWVIVMGLLAAFVAVGRFAQLSQA